MITGANGQAPREFVCAVSTFAGKKIDKSLEEEYSFSQWPKKLIISGNMPAKTSELQKLAETHSLPFIHIYPSAGNTVENSSIFDALTKNLGIKKVVATVRFPQIGPNAGMVLIYNEKRFNLIGLLFLKVPIPNLTVGNVGIAAGLQQQQQQQLVSGQPQQFQPQPQQPQPQPGINSPNIMSPSNQPGVLTPQQQQQQQYLLQAQLIQQQKARLLQQQQQQQLAFQQQQASSQAGQVNANNSPIQTLGMPSQVTAGTANMMQNLPFGSPLMSMQQRIQLQQLQQQQQLLHQQQQQQQQQQQNQGHLQDPNQG
ncbi:hypothetical protein BGZ98_007308 [Dissophora globulifera]|nr:hypothetical protein BGZ98_007308 [Dissophora globulifera]